MPGIDRFRRQWLAGSGQKPIPTRELYHLIVGTTRQDPVEAGLLGERVDGGEVVVCPGGHQPVGSEERALRCFPLSTFQLEAAVGNPRFGGFRASLHKCDG
jgi:hypothetical protein